ncbi:Extracellular esterase EstB [Vanrija pseudolonga]|uniref:Extracellular esterase EstB n=1 Tax=Vanrija pseudolonga TaxID=143232 RepID=A0AAF0Y2B6_9TREE|nr:Extracellular esterase EstB [Vanrija pseudolonga]
MRLSWIASALVASTAVMAAPAVDETRIAARATSGINDYNCQPQPGKNPVIFLHGLGAPSGINWFTKAPIVAANGYCVFTPQYGSVNQIWFGFASMRDSSKEVAGIVQKVLQSTGAKKVNIVGHSMGTTVGSYYIKFDGGKDFVEHFVGFGANYKGTSLYGLDWLVHTIPGVTPAVRAVCKSCVEFLPPSAFLDDLNRGGVSVPGVDYTTISSKLDEFVLPYTSGQLTGEPGVTNIVIQTQCGWIPDLAGHLAQAVDPNVTAWILWALGGKKGPIPGCVPNLLISKREDVPAIEA